MNNDRIGDLYEGEIGTPALRRTARRRIHWMCARATSRVLDLGCSQGIASILLGREGREVVGIDRETQAVESARRRLSLESEAVRSRVRFEIAEGTSLPYEDASFDSVLLGEILEHQLSPSALLASSNRVLRPGGVAVITVPYGLFRYHDHKGSIYVGELVDAISEWWAVGEVVLIDRYIGVSARKLPRSESDPPAVPWRAAVAVADRRIAALDDTLDGQARELHRLRSEVEALRSDKAERDGLSAALEVERERASNSALDIEAAKDQNRRLVAEIEEARVSLARAEAERDEARRTMRLERRAGTAS